MLIALYLFIVGVVLPQLIAYALAIFEILLLVFLTFATISILLIAIGIKITTNFGEILTTNIFKAIGYIVTNLVKAVSWIVRKIFSLLPNVFNGSKRNFKQMGLNDLASTLLSILVTIIVLAIII